MATGAAGAVLIAARIRALAPRSTAEVVGGPYPPNPGPVAGHGLPAFDAALPALRPLARLAWLRGPWAVPALSGLVVAFGRHPAAIGMADLFAADDGPIRRSGEAFSVLP